MFLLKILRFIYVPIVFHYKKNTSEILSKIKPYVYDCLRYRETFLFNDSERPDDKLEDAEKVVYCFWTGDNDLTPARKRSVAQLRSRLSVPLKLITADTLNEYILAEYPLHPGYKYLSYVHRADYLRCYFMHHYGGGYIDVKECTSTWSGVFDELNNSDKYILGYPEGSHFGVCISSTNGNISKDLMRHWRYVVGNGAYVCRPRTKFTQEWYDELNSRMDYYYRLLVLNPGDARRRDNIGYPIPWSNILGDIFQPLCLKYSDRIIQCKDVLPLCRDYK
ncbi:MAG: hypothetical protein R3Y68_03070 [Rikenellaceae bacterium]